ncbi:MAG TPA: hydantoinase B/oxoprolinase family protein [Gemmatimonadota bacterium]|nr:hydantoinase B/oxoprolinase family protein [Gemmatimonadota bacterium]
MRADSATGAAGANPHQRVPLDLGVFHALFVALVEEMATVLQRTALSPNIVERRDHSCALYDASARTIAMGDHMPVHLGSMPLSVRAVRDALELDPGDVAIVNDPASGGTHLPDLTLVRAVFLDGDATPAFYLANRAHHSDVGGRSGGSMGLWTDLWQEGVVLPPVRLLARGEKVSPTWRHLLAGVRTPEERAGDLAAQLASLETGERRLRALIARYGRAKLAQMGNDLIAYTARAVRAAVADLPDGTYEFADRLDGDGTGQGPLGIRVRLTVEGEAAGFDFRGTSGPARGPLNANPAIVRSAVQYVVRALCADDLPANDGLLEPVAIEVPPGSLLDPGPGSAVSGGNVETSQRVVDVVLGALALAVPDRIPAASQGTMNNLALSGALAGGRPYTYYETVAGGAGGHPDRAGASGIHTHMTNSLNTPVEALERALPVRVVRYGYRRGSGGAGKRPGGDGIVRELEALEPMEGTFLADRRRSGPWGLAGGKNGRPGEDRIVRNGKAEPLPAKGGFDLAPGDRISIETPGGGGWGRGTDR